LSGSAGIQGEQGLQGIQGEQGVQGIPGLKGDKGDQGEQGLQGEKGDVGMPRLVIVSTVVDIPAMTTQYVPLDATLNKYDVRTVCLTSNTEDNLTLRISEEALGSRFTYVSNTEKEVYDIVQLPTIDKDLSETLHTWITNGGNGTATCTLEVKLTELV
jgi:hypothetical protein